LRLVDLCLIGVDLGLLHNDLRIDILDIGSRSGYLSLSLGKRIAVIAVVDPRDHLAGNNMLVVGNRDRREVTGDFGGDRELTCSDEGVVRRFEMRGVVPIDIARRQRHKEEDQTADERKRVPPQHALTGLVTALVISMLDIVIFAFRRPHLYSGLVWCMVPRGRRSQPHRKL
jgi:hypothetical protein